MKAMAKMGYTAVGIGEYEASMPLTKTLDAYALNNEKPRVVCANLENADLKYPGETKTWQLAEPIKGSALTLGVTGLVGPSVRDQIKKKDSSVDWIDSTPALNAVLKEMNAAKVDLHVLLYMGSISQGLPAHGGSGGLRGSLPAVSVNCCSGRHRRAAFGPALCDRSEDWRQNDAREPRP